MTRDHLGTTAIAAAAVAALVAISLLAPFLTGGSSIMAGSATGPFAYVANLSSGQVSVIDLPTETEVTAIATGGEPYWVAISSDGSTVAASLHNSTGVALIDGVSNTLLGVVGGVGSEPEAVAVSSDGGTVYVGDESGDDLYVVDVGTETVTSGPIDISSDCSEPENMVISPDDAFLYVTCTGSSVIRVATSGFAITSIDTGLGDPHGIALRPDGTLLYYTDGTDVLEWDTGSETLTGTTFSGCDMYGGRVSPDGSQLFCQEENGDLMVFDTSDGSLTGTVTTGATAVAVRGDGSRAYAPAGNVVEVVDAITVTDLPGNITMSGNGGRGIAIGPEPQPTPTPTPTPTPEPTATPTQAAPAALPPTGNEPPSAGNGWLYAVLAGALALAGAGGALVAAHRRR